MTTRPCGLRRAGNYKQTRKYIVTYSAKNQQDLMASPWQNPVHVESKSSGRECMDIKWIWESVFVTTESYNVLQYRM